MVEKKAAHVVSNSELETLYSSLIDNKEILQCFSNLPCYLLNNEKEKVQRNEGNIKRIHTLWHIMESIIFVIPMLYLNLPEDMVEDNPLELENIKEKQDKDNDLQQS